MKHDVGVLRKWQVGRIANVLQHAGPGNKLKLIAL